MLRLVSFNMDSYWANNRTGPGDVNRLHALELLYALIDERLFFSQGQNWPKNNEPISRTR